MKLTTTNKTLKKFGLIATVYFLLIDLLISHLHHHPMLPSWSWLLVATFVMLCLVKPTFLQPLHTLYHYLLTGLHWINSRILLGAIFFLIFAPIGLARRLFKKDTLNLMLEPHKTTYRVTLSTEQPPDIRRPY